MLSGTSSRPRRRLPWSPGTMPRSFLYSSRKLWRDYPKHRQQRTRHTRLQQQLLRTCTRMVFMVGAAPACSAPHQKRSTRQRSATTLTIKEATKMVQPKVKIFSQNPSLTTAGLLDLSMKNNRQTKWHTPLHIMNKYEILVRWTTNLAKTRHFTNMITLSLVR